MQITSKLPNVGTTIFTVMSALANEHKAINLSQGFPNFSSSPRLHELVYKYMRKGYNQYPSMLGVPVLRERIAEKIEKLYNVPIDPQTEITITAGATQALFTAVAAFVHEGDEVIIIEPAFDCYAPAIELVGGKVVPYALQAPDFRVNWEALQQLITPKTRMIMINSPHNPTGQLLKKDDLLALQKIVDNTDILVLSDEVYEHLTFDGEPHETILKYPDLRKRSLAVFSFGKTFHTTGWKMGYCVAPPELMVEFRKVHQFVVFTVNAPVQHALAEFLENEDEYLSLPNFFQQKRDFFLQKMQGSRLQPLTCEGTYFHLFDYGKISDEPDTAFAKRMTTEYGVAAIPVSVFYQNAPEATVIRLCFAKTEETLEQAGELLQKL